MKTQLISAEVAIADRPQPLPQIIEAVLRQWGEPLRWAITQVDADRQIARVEAVVTTAS